MKRNENGGHETSVFGGTVETWYDRQTRNWVTQLKDTKGNQVGDAAFSGTKLEAFEVDHLDKMGEANTRFSPGVEDMRVRFSSNGGSTEYLTLKQLTERNDVVSARQGYFNWLGSFIVHQCHQTDAGCYFIVGSTADKSTRR